jgi:hypothetical protein
MTADVALRWVVTVLFGLSVAECAQALLAHRGQWPTVVNHALHLVMSVAMIVMAWPWGMNVPTFPSMLLFLLAALWFAGLGLAVSTQTHDRLVNAYHAVMMAAMAWMYAAMNGDLLTGTSAHAPNHPGMNMPGMGTPTTDPTADASGTGWIATVSWLLVAFFAGAAAYWLYRYIGERRAAPRGAGALAHAGVLCQAFMAAGMAISFAVMT